MATNSVTHTGAASTTSSPCDLLYTEVVHGSVTITITSTIISSSGPHSCIKGAVCTPTSSPTGVHRATEGTPSVVNSLKPSVGGRRMTSTGGTSPSTTHARAYVTKTCYYHTSIKLSDEHH